MRLQGWWVARWAQVCQPAWEEGVPLPAEVREVWLLVDEFVLCEAQRSLLKLLRDVDALPGRPPPPVVPGPPAEASTQVQPAPCLKDLPARLYWSPILIRLCSPASVKPCVV